MFASYSFHYSTQQEKMQQKNRLSTKRVGFSIYKNGITKHFGGRACR